MDYVDLLKKMFLSAVEAVHPKNLIYSSVEIDKKVLHIEREEFYIPDKVYVFGSGKASIEMAKAVEGILGEKIKEGVVICNYREKLKKIEVVEGSHPVPDENSLKAGDILYEKISSLSENDFFIYLLSGGSSSLVEKLIPPITLEDLKILTDLLLKKSVPIEDINVVRKHISQIKGGRLGHSTKARGIVLVISDVVGDDLFTIGSAPLYYDKSTYKDAKNILQRYNLWENIPYSVKTVIQKGLKGEIPDTPKEENPRIKHFIVGNNFKALKQAQSISQKEGLKAHIITSQLKGEAREVAKVLSSIGKEIKKTGNPYNPPVCLLFGGETTVNVRGSGKGGRNQELCLSFLKEIKDTGGIYLLSGGTDGIDGNSDAAGAFIDKNTYKRALDKGLDIDSFLENNDSYHFFKETGNLIFTGYTGTNVMDITIMIVGE